MGGDAWGFAGAPGLIYIWCDLFCGFFVVASVIGLGLLWGVLSPGIYNLRVIIVQYFAFSDFNTS